MHWDIWSVPQRFFFGGIGFRVMGFSHRPDLQTLPKRGTLGARERSPDSLLPRLRCRARHGSASFSGDLKWETVLGFGFRGLGVWTSGLGRANPAAPGQAVAGYGQGTSQTQVAHASSDSGFRVWGLRFGRFRV